MKQSNVERFVALRKIRLLSTFHSNERYLLSGVVKHIDDVSLLGAFSKASSQAKTLIKKTLKAYLSSLKVQDSQGYAVFIGIADNNSIACEIFGIAGSTAGLHTPLRLRTFFKKELLDSLSTTPTPALVVMVDEHSCTTFMVKKTEVQRINEYMFQNQQDAAKKKTEQGKIFRRQLSMFSDTRHPRKLVLGLHENLKFLKEVAREDFKGFQVVASPRITEVNRMNLETILIANYSVLKEFDVILELKCLRSLFSQPQHGVLFGVAATLGALQEHRLTLLLVHSTLQAVILVPHNDEQGLATVANDEEVNHEFDRVELFAWFERNEHRFKCSLIVVQSDTTQGQQLAAAGGVAGIFK